MLTIKGTDGLQAKVGEELGLSDWVDVTQEDINLFADATGDHQWIHVDVDRAAKESPFGTTIAHGFYTLSLVPRFMFEMFTIEGFALIVNYGANKVRFPAPVPVGSRVRMRALLQSVEEVAGGVQLLIVCTFEREGEGKPVCVAEALMRAYGGGS